MHRRMILLAAIAALTAVGFGGATLASAGSKPSTPKPAASAPTKAKPTIAAPTERRTTATDGDNVQQGDQSSPDTGAASESNSEAEATGPDSDAAAQDAACKAAGIDPTADNVQYDPQTGCSLDVGANSGN